MRLRPTPLAVCLGLSTLAAVAVTVWGLRALDAVPSRLPGHSFVGTPPPLDPDGRELRQGLRTDLLALAETIGERNTRRPDALADAADYIATQIASEGLRAERHGYRASGVDCDNVYVDMGQPLGSQLLVGAHYDSAIGSPGGNDNASGVAVVLALARRFARQAPPRWLRFVFFVNEEPPHFRTATMGSRAYAEWAAGRGELPAEVVVLDSVGFYSSAAGSQRFPSPGLTRLFGNRGDFVAFVGTAASEDLLLRVGGAFRVNATLPSEGAVFSTEMAGVAWSDHSSFWRHGVPAILVTDTATFRDTHYHEPSDSGEQIDLDALTRLTLGLESALRAEL